MDVTVRTLTGERLTVQVEPGDMVATLKSKIKGKCTFFLRGQKLSEQAPFASLGLRNGEFIVSLRDSGWWHRGCLEQRFAKVVANI